MDSVCCPASALQTLAMMEKACLQNILLTLCLAFIDVSHAQCSENWFRIGDFCYLFVSDIQSSYADARSECAKVKGRLPVFANRQEYNVFEETMTVRFPNLTIALGIEVFMDSNGPKTIWADSGRPAEFTLWENGSRTAANQNVDYQCVIRSDKGWRNVLCGDADRKVIPLCQQGTNDTSNDAIPCAVIHRLNAGWIHILTTNQAAERRRDFHINETNKVNGDVPLYAATIHKPGITVPLYEAIGPRSSSSSQVAMVLGDAELTRLMLADVTEKTLYWSFDPPSDTVVVGTDAERKRLIADWKWIPKSPVYFFTKQDENGMCHFGKNCTLTSWSEWSECSATCDQSVSFRKRSVITAALGQGSCGALFEEQTCVTNPCISPVDLTAALEEAGILDSVSDSASRSASISNTMPSVFGSLNVTEGGVEIGHSINDTVQFCMYANHECDVDEHFDIVVNPYMGNCYTFNGRDPGFFVTRGGPHGGFRVLLSVDQPEYLCTTEAAGLKVLVHPQSEYAFVETFGQNIAPGTVTSMSLTMTTIQKIDTGFGSNKCVESLNDPRYPNLTYYYSGGYTPEGCLRSCIQDYVIMSCRCADPRYGKPDNVRYCADHQVRCPDYYQNVTCNPSYRTEVDCPCHSPCLRTFYDTVISTALLRNEELGRIQCVHNESAECSSAVPKHYALLEIYFDRLRMYQFTEEPAIDIMFLFSDISGMTGNLNGFCIITIFEFGVLLAQLVSHFCSKGAKKSAKLSQPRVPFVRLLAESTTMADFVCFCLTFTMSVLVIILLYVFRIFGTRS